MNENRPVLKMHRKNVIANTLNGRTANLYELKQDQFNDYTDEMIEEVIGIWKSLEGGWISYDAMCCIDCNVSISIDAILGQIVRFDKDADIAENAIDNIRTILDLDEKISDDDYDFIAMAVWQINHRVSFVVEAIWDKAKQVYRNQMNQTNAPVAFIGWTNEFSKSLQNVRDNASEINRIEMEFARVYDEGRPTKGMWKCINAVLDKFEKISDYANFRC